jgi:hypothetical protein
MIDMKSLPQGKAKYGKANDDDDDDDSAANMDC